MVVFRVGTYAAASQRLQDTKDTLGVARSLAGINVFSRFVGLLVGWLVLVPLGCCQLLVRRDLLLDNLP